MIINKFDGKFAFLSNFYGTRLTVEHRFQAMKTKNLEEKTKILEAETPGKAKKLGRKATLRADWNNIKVEIMFQLVWKKFMDPELRRKLLATGDALLIEGNYWHDNFWGICNCERCKGNIGQNMLGKILMFVRDKIKEVK